MGTLHQHLRHWTGKSIKLDEASWRPSHVLCWLLLQPTKGLPCQGTYPVLTGLTGLKLMDSRALCCLWPTNLNSEAAKSVCTRVQVYRKPRVEIRTEAKDTKQTHSHYRVHGDDSLPGPSWPGELLLHLPGRQILSMSPTHKAKASSITPHSSSCHSPGSIVQMTC